MSGTTLLHILFGGVLVALGVLAGALADRIRERTTREGAHANTPSRSSTRRTQVSNGPIHAAAQDALPKRSPSAPRTQIDSEAADVIAALVIAGHKKQIATEATWACGAAERTSIESWTRAALRRCTPRVSSQLTPPISCSDPASSSVLLARQPSKNFHEASTARHRQ